MFCAARDQPVNVGTLTIEIAAGVARLQADMNDAKRVVTTATKETEAAVGFLKTALGVAEEDAAAAQATGLIEMVSVGRGLAHLGAMRR